MKCVTTNVFHAAAGPKYRSSICCRSAALGNLRGKTTVHHSVWSASEGFPSAAYSRSRRRRCVYPEASLSGLGGSEDEASFFIRNLRALPWQRAAVWLVVIVTALQLSDFFGVWPAFLSATCIMESLRLAATRAEPHEALGVISFCRSHSQAFPSVWDALY